MNRFYVAYKCEILRAIMMGSTFDSDCRNDNNISNLIWNVNRPIKMCSRKLCVHQATLQSLGTSENQSQHYASASRVRDIPFEARKNWFLLMCPSDLHL